MDAYVGVNLGNEVPDWSDFEPGGSREGETPIGNLLIETAGLDSSNGARATSMVSTGVPPLVAQTPRDLDRARACARLSLSGGWKS